MIAGKTYYIVKFIIFLSAAFFLETFAVFSFVEISRVVVEPLNRALFYMSELPGNYSSELSPDKKRIAIKLPNAQVAEKARNTASQGVIANVYIQSFEKYLEISVVLREIRGYTASLLPYSKALMVEAFKWDKLGAGEDMYRCGLLALENNLLATAKGYFRKSFSLGTANAGVFLGIILLREGKNEEALNTLRTAELNNANIPDLWAALNQAYKIIGETAAAQKAEKLFLQKSGMKSVEDISIDGKILPDTLPGIPALISGAKDTSINVSDSLKNTYLARDTVVKDSSKLNFDLLNTGVKDENKGSNSSLINKAVIYIIVTLAFISIFIFTSYFRWKRKQKKAKNPNNRNQSPDFANTLNMEKNMLAKSLLASKAYKKSESIRDISDVSSNGKSGGDKTADSALSSELKAESIIKPEKPVTGQTPDARVELTRHILDEQRKKKAKEIENIANKEIPDDSGSLLDLAKKLGVEKSTLEAKKNLSNLEKDDTAIERLKEKFSPGKSENIGGEDKT